MPALIVAGAGTDIGKTWVAASLIRTLKASGAAVDAFKPVISGFDPDTAAASDAGVLLAALGRPITPETVEAISPLRFAAPMSPPLAAAREGREISFEAVADACRARMATAGEALLLIETAGGLMSPLSETKTMLDLIGVLDAPVLLVTGDYLGAISHTLTAIEVLRSRGHAIAAVAVNESPEPGATLEETRASLQTLAGEVPIVTVERNGEVPAELVDLFR